MADVEAVALVVALASLVISVAALYATALKRAQIGMHQATVEQPWQFGGWNALTPSGEGYVALALYAHNAGANAGILEDVQIASDSTLRGVLRHPVSWYPVKTSRSSTRPTPKRSSRRASTRARWSCSSSAGSCRR